MKEIVLSYVLTTYNKIDYLKITLPRLIEACKEGEEIIVTDGGSTDGTSNYLRELLNAGKIHTLLSESDEGEAHGYNKAFMLAQGKLIKIISDDDAYDFEVVQTCKDFMLTHPQIDLLGTNGLGYSYYSNKTNFRDDSSSFRKFLTQRIPMHLTGLSYLIRKSSLPLLGLFHTGFIIIDFEYSLRITAGKGKLALYNGCSFCNIVNPNSNSNKYWIKLYDERKVLEYLYLNKNPYFSIDNYLYLKSSFKAKVKKILRIKNSTIAQFNYKDIFEISFMKLSEHNKQNKGEFIF